MLECSVNSSNTLRNMELNKIKLLSKEGLLKHLKQRGFDQVATILYARDINGNMLLNLSEFDTIRWGLTFSEKKLLWNCVQEIKSTKEISKPQHKTIPPKLPDKSAAIKGRSLDNQTGALFKGKLSEILGGPGTVSILPSKNKPQSRPKENETPVQRPARFPSPTNSIKDSRFVKSLNTVPPPPPPPSRDLPQKTNSPGRKALPLPVINQAPLSNDYMKMSPPPFISQDSDDYLHPNEIQQPQNAPNRSPNLAKRNKVNDTFQKSPTFPKRENQNEGSFSMKKSFSIEKLSYSPRQSFGNSDIQEYESISPTEITSSSASKLHGNSGEDVQHKLEFLQPK